MSQTSHTQDCRINHRSRAGLSVVWSIRQSLRVLWCRALVVINFAASHSCLSVINQRQNPLGFMTYSRKFNTNLIWATAWENLSTETCETSLSRQSRHFGNYFGYLVSEQQRHRSDCAFLLVMSWNIEFNFSLHFITKNSLVILYYMYMHKSRILWTLWHSFD